MLTMGVSCALGAAVYYIIKKFVDHNMIWTVVVVLVLLSQRAYVSEYINVYMTKPRQ